MPWASLKQERWGNSSAGKAKMGADKVAEFNRASKGITRADFMNMTPRKKKKKKKGDYK